MSLFNKTAGRLQRFLKKTLTQSFSCENCKIFKNNYVCRYTILRHINALFSSSFNSWAMNYNHFYMIVFQSPSTAYVYGPHILPELKHIHIQYIYIYIYLYIYIYIIYIIYVHKTNIIQRFDYCLLKEVTMSHLKIFYLHFIQNRSQ